MVSKDNRTLSFFFFFSFILYIRVLLHACIVLRTSLHLAVSFPFFVSNGASFFSSSLQMELFFFAFASLGSK
jgi:hypothetical protein